ncbi:LacI family DNA-binding transcriptional regulator [Acetobacter oeni]|uniref:LacI family DNA-binding transcriptional regulator n=1 Tax=Acetobacter oeni TaxID=304077 RepID=UPI0017A0A930|nr:substrate-binding domain-containing protein [Acetobacter oeni]MBB3882401.1 DNA-binding LacI/PurR family transcriptional regulator [Acetobacter oeni]
MRERRPVTSVDVAKRAGVSQSAVSRAFSRTASIAPGTREKILKAAAELDYRPNRIPAIMLSGRSGMVGVVVGGLSNPFYAGALEHLVCSLRERGLQVLLVHVDDALTLDDALEQLLGYRIDAVVTALAIGSKAVAKALDALRIPVICFNSRLTGQWISTVSSNNRAAGVVAARVLRERGVMQPVWLAGALRNAASVARGEGFRRGLGAMAGELVSLQGADTYESGYDAVSAMLLRGVRPDGMFCSNDMMACGAIDALCERAGLSCSRDVMLLGYDNIPQGAWRAYDLTTFDQGVGQLVKTACEVLANALEAGGEPVSQNIVIEARLVERGSTAGG